MCASAVLLVVALLLRLSVWASMLHSCRLAYLRLRSKNASCSLLNRWSWLLLAGRTAHAAAHIVVMMVWAVQYQLFAWGLQAKLFGHQACYAQLYACAHRF
jgi:hypothetical protein